MTDPDPDAGLSEDGGEAGSSRSYAHRWLLLVPFVWQIGLVPFANEVDARPLGLPFPMVWQMLGILVATVVIGIVSTMDRRQECELHEEDGAQ